MKLFLPLVALIGYISQVQAQLPPTLTIGDIDGERTEFNVGEGTTDETASLNHIFIVNTSGTEVGIVNDPNTTEPGVKYYEFNLYAPGCEIPGDGNVTLNGLYDNDGHLTGENEVDLQLSVDAWAGSTYEIEASGDQPTKFGVCIQANIMIVNDNSESVMIESKNFDIEVTPILSTFTVGANTTSNLVAVGSLETDSGTTVSGEWKSSELLPPGEPIWFVVVADRADYVVVGFEYVTMILGGNEEDADDLISETVVTDNSLTSSEVVVSGNVTELHFYHILPRSKFASTQQVIELSGKALVSYVGDAGEEGEGRRLRGTEDRELTSKPEEADFAIKAMMKADDGSDSGGFTVEILSMVIGGVGVVGAALL